MPPGDLDGSFSGDGKRAISFGGTDVARVVLVQPNGRIVVAGGGAAASSFCVARSKALRRGSYRLTATARDPAGNRSKRARARFTIVEARPVSAGR